jgi:S-methylmethionine-dependent homocysteine/selenocysteine methylase
MQMCYSPNFFLFTVGADVLITNTYQANIGGFVTYLGLNEEASYELIKTAVHLARRAQSMYMEEKGPDGDSLFSVHCFWQVP